MSPGARAGIAVILVAAAGPAGFFAYRLLLASHVVQPSQTALTAELARSSQPPGAAAPAGGARSAAARPLIPARLPQITLPDRSGTPRSLSDWRGRPLLVNFWATWCSPCRHEIPMLEKLRRSEAADHLQVVGIAVDDRDAVLAYARSMHIDYPILIGGDAGGLAAIQAFGMPDALPFTVFADSRGRILTVKVGELHADGARLIIARLQDVDRGTLSIAAARAQISAGLEALAVARARQVATGRPPAKS